MDRGRSAELFAHPVDHVSERGVPITGGDETPATLQSEIQAAADSAMANSVRTAATATAMTWGSSAAEIRTSACPRHSRELRTLERDIRRALRRSLPAAQPGIRPGVRISSLTAQG